LAASFSHVLREGGAEKDEVILASQRSHFSTLTKSSRNRHQGPFATAARGDSAIKKKQDFITLVFSRSAIHLMAIAYAGCEIISRS
jgi:hypothetical protein